jgi:hypothetical protein
MSNGQMRDLIRISLQMLRGGRKAFTIDGKRYYAKSVFLSRLSLAVHRESYRVITESGVWVD